jgi:hypothetical protein
MAPAGVRQGPDTTKKAHHGFLEPGAQNKERPQ